MPIAYVDGRTLLRRPYTTYKVRTKERLQLVTVRLFTRVLQGFLHPSLFQSQELKHPVWKGVEVRAVNDATPSFSLSEFPLLTERLEAARKAFKRKKTEAMTKERLKVSER